MVPNARILKYAEHSDPSTMLSETLHVQEEVLSSSIYFPQKSPSMYYKIGIR